MVSRPPRMRIARAVAVLAAVITVAAAITATNGRASADPDDPATVTAPDGSYISDIRRRDDRILDIGVYSAAMRTVTRVQVIRAADPDRPAPTLYLLNGANGGISDGSWSDRTDIAEFFADKQVNVVVPFGGASSYFTDWRADDPVLGRQRWRTFLTKELPPIIDSGFGGTGVNAIAGISMAGTSVFQLALAAPGLYKAVGSYSGCVRTSDPQGQLIVDAVVGNRMGNTVNMWGPPTDPAWAANDPYLHADRLRGTAIYVSTGTGLPGPLDTFQGAHGDATQLAYQLVFGAALEGVTNICTHQLHDRLQQLGVPATFDFRPTGTHSWGYWQDDLHTSWSLFAAALGA
ncbi:S-formylglutathione hydrolase FrmB [Nocardia kruczakiae]|uniref:S-formylglutathione hydrolase FrmB n=1 Tax=Nocardia kruczakiae TaxID=261477 RepID=A0ABU1XQ55_9NOCA|nr:alpha/beta hydrolase family protein [Nocardia kruczakiae]MDR7172651.1 S-formylglutathione hydrolase FrmB [Nocardia kruczakiae]